MITNYGRDCFLLGNALPLDDKVITLTTHDDSECGTPARVCERVRCMYAGGYFVLLLADGDPGPAEQVHFWLIKTVEVHA